MQKMNEKEAIRMLKQGNKWADEVDFSYEQFLEALHIAIQALEEIQQYRATGMTPEQIKEMQMDYCAKGAVLEEYKAIGTVKECREAVERIRPKKPDLWGDGYSNGQLVYDIWDCPNCGKSYNDGWIPCSERLPTDGEVHECTAQFSTGMLYIEYSYYDIAREEWWAHDDTGLVNVIAWREHPAPYQPKGE